MPITLRVGANAIDLVASIDTGASNCIFETAYENELDLDLASGIHRRFRTANSGFDTFGHEGEIDTFGIRTHSLVYFFAEPSISKNVLGRTGWLNRVRIGLVDHDRALYLAPYD